MRVALFFTPPPQHPLTREAELWLGRNAFSGERFCRSATEAMAQSEIEMLTEAPRRYGFHATLKAPFRLVEGRRLQEVEEAMATVCAGLGPVDLGKLRLEQIGRFFALTPSAECSAVNELAEEMVRRFDSFRAPQTEDEIARRRSERLSPRQRDNLQRWGYPYVLADFRFHMTLTGPVAVDRCAVVRETLEKRFLPVLDDPVVIDAIALFVESSPPGDFIVRKRVPLSESSASVDAA